MRRRLGAGGFGEVFEVYDRERGAVLALKLLTRLDASSLLSFKREFRSLADLVHPNLVTLYELVSTGDRWLFTMELVEGQDFISYVTGRSSGTVARTGPVEESLDDTLAWGTPPAQQGPSGGSPSEKGPEPPDFAPARASDWARLRGALTQLVQGSMALHAAGKLHRDLKPSNVLVTPGGRVRILDFGLVADKSHDEQDEEVSGTPAYMAPEQALGQAQPASDFYAIGGMLYQALTGRLPFEGQGVSVLMAKLERSPPSPEALLEGLPTDLCGLCVDLLRQAPHRRPDGEAILARLAAPDPEPRVTPRPETISFVGRASQLAALRRAYDALDGRRPVALLVRGTSGMGKTSLVERFLAELLPKQRRCLLLRGRCHPQESVPFKAFDSVIDELSRWLARRPQERLEALPPEELAALARLFPVMERFLPRPASPGPESPPDPQAARQQGARALRGLLDRLARQRPVVIFLDDLQRSDADSAWLLRALLQPPEPPPLLLLGCHREEGAQDPLGEVLGDLRQRGDVFASFEDLALVALAEPDARRLARALVGAPGAVGEADLVDEVVREAAGSPFFLRELAHHLRPGGQAGDCEHRPDRSREGGEPASSVERMIADRLSALPKGAQRMLETLAVAGRPLPRRVLRDAALGDVPDAESAFAALRAARLLRAGARDRVEVYHDRIRLAVLADLPPERLRRHHRALAETLVQIRDADPEPLAYHFEAAGETARAGHFAQVAARRASEVLAFDRAAQLYGKAISLQTEATPQTLALQERMARALANAGRGVQAAEAYLRAAQGKRVGHRQGKLGARRLERLELERRAGDQYLRSGHPVQGLEVLDRVLGELGMRSPPSPLVALASLLAHRAVLRIRGNAFTERALADTRVEDRLRLDTLFSLGLGLSQAEPIRAASYMSRFMLGALRLGEPGRVARGMALHAASLAMGGWRARHRSEKLVGEALALGRRIDDPVAMGQALLSAGVAAYLFGRWPETFALCEQADQVLRERCVGVWWELTEAQTYMLASRVHSGRLRDVAQRYPRALAEVQDRDDRFGLVAFKAVAGRHLWLAAHRPGRAMHELDQLLPRNPPAHYRVENWRSLSARSHVLLYQGYAEAAWQLACSHWPPLRRSLMLRVPMVRHQTLLIRAFSAIAARRVAPVKRRPELERAVSDALRSVRRDPAPYCRALTQLLEASLAFFAGDAERGLRCWEEAEEGFREGGMALHHQAIRFHRGRIIGGDGGRALVAEARAVYRAEGVREPDLMIRGYIPDPRG